VLQERVDASTKARVGQGSREQYANSMVRFFQWCSVNEKKKVMNKGWMEVVARESGVAFPEDGDLTLDDKFTRIVAAAHC